MTTRCAVPTPCGPSQAFEGLAGQENSTVDAGARQDFPEGLPALLRRASGSAPVEVRAAVLSAAEWLASDSPPEATKALESALLAAPDALDVRVALAALLQQRGLADEAEQCLRLAAEDHGAPRIEATCRLGHLLIDLGRLAEAEALFRGVLDEAPESFPAVYGLGKTLKRQGRVAEAEGQLRAAIALHPDSLGVLNELGDLLRTRQGYSEAESLLRRARIIAPADLQSAITLSIVLHEQGRPEEAIAVASHGLLWDPNSVGARTNIARSLIVLGNYEAAERLCRSVLQDSPEHAIANVNLGLVLLKTGRPVEAVAHFRQAIATLPSYDLAKYNLAVTLLLLGHYEEGWALHESRWQSVLKQHAATRNLGRPHWDGASFPDKTLLIHWEQGFGDTLQFIRYALLAAERGGRVIVVVQKPLVRLLEEIDGIEVVSEVPEGFDFFCHMLSLPRVFGTTLNSIPAAPSYVQPPSDARRHWARWFDKRGGSSGKIRIGVAWAGNVSHINDIARSIAFDDLAPLWEIEGVQWVLLQMDGKGPDVVDAVRTNGWLDPMGDVRDYGDTAAIIELLDLVISVDTSVVHLAGALGKPVWAMLPFDPDWRWARQYPDSSPWYPSMRLFRQEALGEWHPVIRRVADALRCELSLPGATPPDSGAELDELPVVAIDHERAALPPMAVKESDTGPEGGVTPTPEEEATRDLAERVRCQPYWYHRIPLPGGIHSPGWAPLYPETYELPDRLDGMRVLDVGAWDGYWTFEALKRGAREVVAIDDFSDTQGVEHSVAWRSWSTFDLCKEALGYDDSVCRRIEMSVYEASEAFLGRFDVILFFGTLHQLRYPLLALDRLAAICDGEIYIESPILDDYSPYRGLLAGYPNGQMLMEYYPERQYGNNPANNWSPTLQCLGLMVRSAGFPEPEGWKLEDRPRRLSLCRGFVKARKG